MPRNNRIDFTVGYQLDKSGLNEIKKSLQELSNLNPWNQKEKGLKLDSTALTQIREQAKAVEVALEKAFNPNLNTVNISKFRESLQASNTNLATIRQNFSKAGADGERAFNRLGTTLLTQNNQMKQSNKLLNEMAKTMANTIKWGIASSVMNTFTGAVQQAYGYVQNLDSSLNNIRIVTGKSTEEMQKFAQVANDAAKGLGAGTVNYTDAALIYYQQGLSDAEVQARTDVTLKAANVTGQTAAAVSEQLTAVWNGFQVDSAHAEEAIDKLAAVAATTASDLEELSVGMSKVASAANAMGVNEDQLAAQLSTIISVTRQAPESVGTALKTIYARMTDIQAGMDEEGTTLGNYTGKMAAMGVNVLDATGKLRDMGDVIEEIGAKWENYSREQQIALAQTMAGTRQYNNLIALFDSWDQYESALKTSQEATGTLQEQQDIYMESTKAHLQQLKTQWEDLYDSIIDTGTINTVTDAATALLGVFTSFIDSIGGGGNALAAFGAIATQVFSTQIGNGISQAINNFAIGTTNIENMKAKMQTIRDIKTEDRADALEKLANTVEQNIHNFDLLTEAEQREINASMAMVEEAENEIQIFNKEADEVNNLVQRLGNIDSKKDPEGHKAAQTFDVREYQVAEGEDIYDPLTAAIDKLTTAAERGKEEINNFDKVIGQADEIKRRTQQIENLRQIQLKYQNAQNEQDTQGRRNYDAVTRRIETETRALQKLQSEFLLATKSGEEGTNKTIKSLDDLRSKLQSIADQTKKEGTNVQQSPLHQQTIKTIQVIDELKSSYNTFIKEVNANDGIASQNSIDKLRNSVTAFENEVRRGNISLEEAADTLLNMGERGKEAYEKLKREAEEAEKTLQGFLDKLNSQAEIKGATQAFTGFSQAISGLFMLGNLGNIWSNENLTGLQKFGQTIQNLTFSLPMLTNGVLTFTAHLKDLVPAYRTLTSEIYRRVAASLAEESEQKKVIVQTTIEQIKTGELSLGKALLSKEIWAVVKAKYAEQLATLGVIGGIGALIAIVGAAVIAYQNWKKAVADQAKAAQENYKKTTEELESLEQELEQVQQRIKELESIEKPSLTDEKDLANLKAENSLLEAQISLAEARAKAAREDVWATTSEDRRVNKSEPVMGTTPNSFGVDIITGETYSATDKFNQMTSMIDFDKLYGVDFDKEGLLSQLKDLSSPEEQAAWFENTFYPALTTAITTAQSRRYDIADSVVETVKKEQEAQETRNREAVQKMQSIWDEKGYSDILSGLYEARDSGQEYDAQLMADLEAENKRMMDLQGITDDLITKSLNSIFDGNSKRVEEVKQLLEDANEDGVITDEELRNIFTEGEYESAKSYIEGLQISWQDWADEVVHNNGIIEKSNEEVIDSINSIPGAPSYSTAKQLSGLKIGDTIDDELYNTLSETQKGFFALNAEGTHTLIDNFDKSNSAIDTNIEEWRKLTAAEEEAIEERQKYLIDASQIKDRNLDTIVSPGIEDTRAEANEKTIVQAQLALTEGYIDDSRFEQIQKEIEENGLALWNTRQELANYVQEIYEMAGGEEAYFAKVNAELDEMPDKIQDLSMQIASTAESTADLESMFDNGQIDDKAYQAYRKPVALKEAETEGFDTEEVQKYADALLEVQNDLKKLGDQADETALEVAVSHKRMVKGVQSLESNWESWGKSLSKIIRDASGKIIDFDDESLEALKDVKEALADALAVDESQISDDFILEYRDAIEDLVNDVDGALENIQQKLANTYIDDIGIKVNVEDTDQAQAALDTMKEQIALFQEEHGEIEVGAVFDAESEADFIAALNGLITDAGWTRDEVNKLLADIGFTPNVSYESYPAAVRSNVYVRGADGQPVQGALISEGEAVLPTITSITGNGSGKTVPKGTKKKGGGGGSGGKGKGKGGGGGGSSKEPEKLDLMGTDAKPIETDPFREINIELAKLTDQLEDLNRIQEKLTGKELINNLNQQLKVLEKQKKALADKLQIQKEEAVRYRNNIAAQGGIFDENGDLTNYEDVITQANNNVAAEIDKYNELVKQYNAMSPAQQASQAGKDLKAQITAQEAVVDSAKEAAESLVDDINDYDDAMQNAVDLTQEWQEVIDQQVQLQIQKFNYSIELRLDLQDFRKEWNKFKREVIDGIDEDDILGNAKADLDNLYGYYNPNGTVTNLSKHIQTIMQEINDKDLNNGWVDNAGIYGNNRAAALEDLKKYSEELMKQMTEFKEQADELRKRQLDLIDGAKEAFEYQKSQYEYINKMVGHNMNLVKMLRGEDAYVEMDYYYEQQHKNNLDNLDFLRREAAMWKEKMDAEEEGSEAWQKYKDNWESANEEIYSSVEDAIQNIIDKYGNAVDKIFSDLDVNLFGSSLDDANEEWEMMNKKGEIYLDQINSAYGIQQLENKIQKSINNTDSLSAQQKLNDLMKDQIGMLKNKQKITQYDIDRAEKLYEIALKEIALQEAQQNKSQMRLRRDANGNYTYEYVSDADAIADAEAELAAAKNDLYNFDLARYKENLQMAEEAYSEFKDKYIELMKDTSLSDEAREQKKKQLIEDYGAIINDRVEENEVARRNLEWSTVNDLNDLYGIDVDNFNAMTEAEKSRVLDDLIPQWESGFQTFAKEVAGDGFFATIKDAIDAIDKEFKDFNNDLNQIERKSGLNFQVILDGDDVVGNYASIVQNNKDLVNLYDKELDQMDEILKKLEAMIKDYENMYNYAKLTAEEAAKFILEDGTKDANSSNQDTQSAGASVGGTSSGGRNAAVPGTSATTGSSRAGTPSPAPTTSTSAGISVTVNTTGTGKVSTAEEISAEYKKQLAEFASKRVGTETKKVDAIEFIGNKIVTAIHDLNRSMIAMIAGDYTAKVASSMTGVPSTQISTINSSDFHQNVTINANIESIKSVDELIGAVETLESQAYQQSNRKFAAGSAMVR